MSWFWSHQLITATYGFLFLSVPLLWLSSRTRMPWWMIPLILSVGFGLTSGVLNPLALPVIILLGSTAYYAQINTPSLLIRILCGMVVVIIGLSASMHIIPGFHNLKVLSNVLISTDAVPFNLYLNFDEVIVGIFIIGFGNNLISKGNDWLLMFKQSLPIAIATIVILMLPALSFRFVHFDLKFSIYFWIWAPVNLFFTCVAEEAFYRGFIQKYLTQLLVKIPFGQIIAILVASLIFGFRHTGKFNVMMLLATIAGIGYGIAYAKTKRIESSIFVHFTFNVTHFLLFTYPVLLRPF